MFHAIKDFTVEGQTNHMQKAKLKNKNGVRKIINVHWLLISYHAYALESLSHFILNTGFEVGTVIILILLTHLREHKDSVQGHAANVWWSLQQSPCS